MGQYGKKEIIETEYLRVLTILKATRKQKNITQSQIGSYLGISGQAYGKIELGKAELGVKTLIKICKYLEIDCFILLDKKKGG